MATVRDIVSRALRKINVVQLGEAPPADEMREGVAAYNELLHSFKFWGADIGHSDQDENGTFPLADEYREGVIHLLANRISPEYERPPGFNESLWMTRLLADYGAAVPRLTVPRALTRPPSREDREGNLPVAES